MDGKILSQCLTTILTPTDWITRLIGLDHLQLSLFPLEDKRAYWFELIGRRPWQKQLDEVQINTINHALLTITSAVNKLKRQ